MWPNFIHMYFKVSWFQLDHTQKYASLSFEYGWSDGPEWWHTATISPELSRFLCHFSWQYAEKASHERAVRWLKILWLPFVMSPWLEGLSSSQWGVKFRVLSETICPAERFEWGDLTVVLQAELLGFGVRIATYIHVASLFISIYLLLSVVWLCRMFRQIWFQCLWRILLKFEEVCGFKDSKLDMKIKSDTFQR